MVGGLGGGVDTMPGGGLEMQFPLFNLNSVKVLGRQDDTAVARNWAGHEVLDIPD